MYLIYLFVLGSFLNHAGAAVANDCSDIQLIFDVKSTFGDITPEYGTPLYEMLKLTELAKAKYHYLYKEREETQPIRKNGLEMTLPPEPVTQDYDTWAIFEGKNKEPSGAAVVSRLDTDTLKTRMRKGSVKIKLDETENANAKFKTSFTKSYMFHDFVLKEGLSLESEKNLIHNVLLNVISREALNGQEKTTVIFATAKKGNILRKRRLEAIGFVPVGRIKFKPTLYISNDIDPVLSSPRDPGNENRPEFAKKDLFLFVPNIANNQESTPDIAKDEPQVSTMEKTRRNSRFETNEEFLRSLSRLTAAFAYEPLGKMLRDPNNLLNQTIQMDEDAITLFLSDTLKTQGVDAFVNMMSKVQEWNRVFSQSINRRELTGHQRSLEGTRKELYGIAQRMLRIGTELDPRSTLDKFTESAKRRFAALVSLIFRPTDSPE